MASLLCNDLPCHRHHRSKIIICPSVDWALARFPQFYLSLTLILSHNQSLASIVCCVVFSSIIFSTVPLDTDRFNSVGFGDDVVADIRLKIIMTLTSVSFQ